MSNSVVPAAAAAQAKHLVNNKKLTKQTEDQKPAQDEQVKADQEPEAANAVQTEEARQHSSSMSDISLSGDFSFAGALADAAEGSASLMAETEAAQGDDGYSSDDSGGGVSSTVLLVGAVGLVGAGIAVAASGGGSSNEAPTVDAASQNVTTAEDTAKQVTVSATDPDGDPLTYSVSTNPGHGTVTGGSGGVFTYTPAVDYNGADSFVVTASDGEGGTVTQTINVTVTPVNDPPKPTDLNDDAVTVAEDGSVEIVIDFEDPEGDAFTGAVSVAPAHGTYNVGTSVYTPDANYNGTDSLTYVVTDANGASTTFTVAITVTPVNDAPVAGADQDLATTENTDLDVTATATDIDGDALTYTAPGTTANGGTVTDNGDGSFTYTPATDYVGLDSFTVTVSDGELTDTQEINIAVGPVVQEFSIDIGVPSGDAIIVGDSVAPPAGDINLAAGDFVLTDDTAVNTNVILQNFGTGDVIEVTGINQPSDYNYQGVNSGGDPNLVDLRITYQDGTAGTATIILIEDILGAAPGIVSNYAQASNVIGYDFLTIA